MNNNIEKEYNRPCLIQGGVHTTVRLHRGFSINAQRTNAMADTSTQGT